MALAESLRATLPLPTVPADRLPSNSRVTSPRACFIVTSDDDSPEIGSIYKTAAPRCLPHMERFSDGEISKFCASDKIRALSAAAGVAAVPADPD